MRTPFFLALLLTVAAAGCGSPESPTQTPLADQESLDAQGDAGGAQMKSRGVRLRPESLPYISVTTIEPKPFAGAISAPAHVDFRAKAISSAGTVVAGRISKIHVQVGDKVKAGDPLATLASAEAAQMRSDFLRAKAELEREENHYRRQEEMKRTGVGLEIERLDAEAQRDEARADYTRSLEALRMLGEGSGEEVIVHAPVAGTVLKANAAVGSAVQPGAALFDLGESSALWIIADVFERDLLLVEKGSRVTIDIPSLDHPITGHVVGESAAIQAELRRASVFIETDSAEVPLRPGMFARVSIQATAPKQIVLPTSAVLIKDGKQTIVYVEIAEGLFEPRNVLVGQAREGMTPVLEGLQGGERVVVKGALLIDAEAAMLL
ncbi:efflux RND transporter periplasmic adaptor subunit [Methylococcus sp. EFPC2]|uniref:efflux RND transporter periplasmic adaptor subunit n=1 Tax=Methylococcus sp. EFPC2 TaxID=2812648 RepID=UPI0019672743|nr:efflux RND transporter periplasmic adaptor subunit [Methylococcus sp. EFPC2]QSA96616.1 efflux RND transporter periplasmic adaptor subunit [Methylococcus sp. EFPC2]